MSFTETDTVSRQGVIKMKLIKKISFGVIGAVALTAMAASPDSKAEAGVIAYSTLQITNVQISAGGEIIGGVTSIDNATSSRASFDDVPGIANSNDTDTAMSCVGSCGTIGQNDFTQVSAANPTLRFARGDALLTGTIPGGDANAFTVAETQLTSIGATNAGGEISNTSFFFTTEFEGDAPGLTLGFDAFGELLAESTEATGFAQADFDWNLQLFDVTGGTLAGFFLPQELNQQVAVSGVGTDSYTIDDSFELTVSGLQANHVYRLSISHNSDVEAALPVPATMAVLGIGLLGLGAIARRRRKSA